MFAIYDTMQYIKPDVNTVCMGMAASAAAVILAGGAKDRACALPHARVMLHQPHGGAQGQASDIEIQARLIVQMRESLNQILAEHRSDLREDRRQTQSVTTGCWPPRPRNTGSSTEFSPVGSLRR